MTEPFLPPLPAELTFRHCLYCHRPLGSNELIEHFQVGRRLAFDADRGRLWAICQNCERWNLSPFETRWEAIEECERAFRETPLRVSTPEIGLARVSEGTELVRIGRPVLPEMAAWRYGDQFGARRRQMMVSTALWTAGGLGLTAAVAFGTGLIAGGAALGGGQFAVQLVHGVRAVRHRMMGPVRVLSNDGTVIPIPRGDQMGAHYAFKAEPSGDWRLTVRDKPSSDWITLDQEHGVQALGQLMPALNPFGATRKSLKLAVAELESVGDPGEYIRRVDQRARKRGYGYVPLGSIPAELRLAVEMAANEENERAAALSELNLLAAAWREAEAVAAEVDDLSLPAAVKEALLDMKRNFGRSRKPVVPEDPAA